MSKALDKSRNVPVVQVYSFWSIAAAILSISCIMACRVECFVLNPFGFHTINHVCLSMTLVLSTFGKSKVVLSYWSVILKYAIFI